MATINFYLREDLKDRKGASPIYLVVQHRGKKFAYFTEEKIKVDQWDAKLQCVKPTFPGS